MHEGQYNTLAVGTVIIIVLYISFMVGFFVGDTGFNCSDIDQREYIHYEGAIADYSNLPQDYPADVFWTSNRSTSNVDGSVFLLRSDKVSVSETVYFEFEEQMDITCKDGEIKVDTYIGREEELNESIW